MRKYIQNLLTDMKLHNRLLISYLIACLIPLIVTTSVIFQYATNSLERASMEFASLFNSQIVTNIDNFIDECGRVTKSVLVDNDVLSDFSSQKEFSIDEQISQRDYLKKIMLRLNISLSFPMVWKGCTMKWLTGKKSCCRKILLHNRRESSIMILSLLNQQILIWNR